MMIFPIQIVVILRREKSDGEIPKRVQIAPRFSAALILHADGCFFRGFLELEPDADSYADFSIICHTGIPVNEHLSSIY